MGRSTADVLDNHLAAFGAGDMERILADYGSESVLISPDGVLTGPDEIKSVFEGMFAEFGKPGASFDMHATHIVGDVAFISWSADTADNVYEIATDTFVVRDGKIAYQTFAGKITPKG